MSEVYWLGGAPPADWPMEAARLGIRPASIEEAHWIGLPPQPAWIAQPPSFDWPESPDGLPARLVQNCACQLASGRRSLILLAAPDGVCLLASPRAVGRLNILPAVRLAGWHALPSGSGLPALANAAGLPLPDTLPAPAPAWLAIFSPAVPPAADYMPDSPRAVQLPPALLERCQELRQELHDPADLLWGLLQDRQLDQLEFTRQQQLDGQNLDFFCPQAGLVVLIDHQAGMEDAYRSHVFAQHGLRVLRFWNSQVIEDTPEVLQAILQAASGSAPSLDHPLSAAPQLESGIPVESRPSRGGIGGLNDTCRALRPGQRSLLVENLPGCPLLFVVLEAI